MRDRRLRLRIGGAHPNDIFDGLEAAHTVFESEAITAEEAATARSEMFSEARELSDEEWRATEVWNAAQKAAIAACCRNWPKERWPDYDVLEFENDQAERMLVLYHAAIESIRDTLDTPGITLPAVKKYFAELVEGLPKLNDDGLDLPDSNAGEGTKLH